MDELSDPTSVPREHADPAASLEQIVDDLEPRRSAEQRTLQQVAAGKSPEEAAQALVAEGWDADTAEEIAEQARRQTRSLRGVVTREQVSKVSEAMYRKGTGLKWFAGFPTFAALRRLLVSLVYLHRSQPKAVRKDQPDTNCNTRL